MLIGTIVACGFILASCDVRGSSETTGSNPGDRSPVVSRRVNTPKGVVLRLWRQIGAGSPTLVYEYDPRVLALVGTRRLLTLFDSPPPEYARPPRVVAIADVPRGVLIDVEGRPPKPAKPTRTSFLVRKMKGRWRVRYDSTLATRLRGQIAGEVADRLPPSSESRDQAALAGNRAVHDLRALFAPKPGTGSLRPR